MDGSSVHAGNDRIAVVARQFVPSRLERQLLAQVFELTCRPQSATEASQGVDQSFARSYGISNDGHAIAAPVARRCAA